MEKLSYKLLRSQNYQGYLLENAPERILMFGEGNFLRAFIGEFVDSMNENAGFNGKIVMCQPASTSMAGSDRINAQDALYTLLVRGNDGGKKTDEKRIISAASRCFNCALQPEELLKCAENPDLKVIISNTTEAGIVYDPACRQNDAPAGTFPGKLTQLLYRRFELFKDQPGFGFIILPCELNDDNGKLLERCIREYAALWQLGDAFTEWLEKECMVCSTLVDRIVTGYPKAEAEKLMNEWGYEDDCMDAGEVYRSWVIEGPESILEVLPFDKAGLPVKFTSDIRLYRERKVRILNGAHTSMVMGAYLAGIDIVRDCMQDEAIHSYMQKLLNEEVMPTVHLPEDELKAFAADVENRFNNPFIDHSLLAIALNSTSKWKSRILPSLKDFVKITGKLPRRMAASMAMYIAFYSSAERREEGTLICRRPAGDEYRVKDEAWVLDFYWEHREAAPDELVHAVLSNEKMWGEDLTLIPGMTRQVSDDLALIWKNGTRELFR